MIADKNAGALEAVLFASGGPVAIADLAFALNTDVRTARKLIDGLAETYEIENRGIKIVGFDDSYQMCTSPEFFPFIEALGKTPKIRTLTPALMETLAIIAYRQPATKTDIENIRGVNADHAVNKLMEYGLVIDTGRADAPGRPVLFATSEDFLRLLGISSLDELPGLPEIPKAPGENG